MTDLRTPRRPLSEWAPTPPASPPPSPRQRSVRSPANASPANGSPANGSSANGSSANGSSSNGSSSNGSSSNGSIRTTAAARPAARPDAAPRRDPASLRKLAADAAPTSGSAAPALVPRRRAAPRPEPDAGRHLRVVGARQRSAAARLRRTRFLCCAAAIAVGCVAFGLVYLHVLSAQKQFELNQLTAREEIAQSNYQRLRLAVQTANSPASITAAARNLGMVEPRGVTLVPGVAAVPSTPGAARSATTAPGGVADWSTNKANLAGTP